MLRTVLRDGSGGLVLRRWWEAVAAETNAAAAAAAAAFAHDFVLFCFLSCGDLALHAIFCLVVTKVQQVLYVSACLPEGACHARGVFMLPCHAVVVGVWWLVLKALETDPDISFLL